MQIRKLRLSVSISPLWHSFLVNRILTGGCYKSVYSKIIHFRRKFISEMKKLKIQWVQYLLRGTTSTRTSIYWLMQCFSKSHLALFLSWLTIVCTVLTHGFIPQQQCREDRNAFRHLVVLRIYYVTDSSPDSVVGVFRQNYLEIAVLWLIKWRW